jgi:hypothetical protein
MLRTLLPAVTGYAVGAFLCSLAVGNWWQAAALALVMAVVVWATLLNRRETGRYWG